jgi:serine/threonine-protein kinase
MALTSGQRIGRYEVIALLDGGGQGEVYRARDTGLPRDVALKVLPEGRLDERHRARFEREARALAALSHPNIAALVAVEESPVLAIVMELVEGESLAARMAAAAGRGLGSAALTIARQIAGALEAAHERGLVHRDLKPANVMLRPDGTVKLVDFGLAKSFRDEGAGAAAATITATEGGNVVGTAAYMSPEQARGTAVDSRTDVWSFGCVLYEMLTGRRAFDGETSSDAIVSVLTREPDLDALPPTVGAGIRRLLRRCLVKDPRNRLRDIGDARIEIEEALAGDRPEPAASPRSVPPHASWPRYTMIGVTCAALAGAAAWLGKPSRPDAPRPVSRSTIPFPASAPLVSSFTGPNIAISPDGARLFYGSTRGFAVRERDRLDVNQLESLGTFAGDGFFSPDGTWIAYFDGPDLMRIPVAGGTPRRVATVGPGATGTWHATGIVFADVAGVFRVSPDGGTLEKLPIAKLEGGEQAANPSILPDGRGLVFAVLPTRTIITGQTGQSGGARIEALDLRSGTQRTLVRGARQPRYLPTGHLLYSAGATLAVVPFDAGTLAVRGQPVTLDVPGDAEFAVSDEGTLIYTSDIAPAPSTLVWVDRQGREEPLGAPPMNYLYPRISPDGRRVALDVVELADRDIWIWDLQRRVLERFTVDPAGNPLMAWSPDGSRLAFGSDRFGPTTTYWQAADGSGSPERLVEGPRIQMPVSFTPDNRLLFSEEVPGEGRNIMALRLDTRAIEPLIRTPTNELMAEVSPDGRWVAYDSNESGRFEIYVRPYPDTSRGRWQISTGGGRQPLWSRDGRELFYRDFSGAVMGARVAPGPTFAAAAVTKILDGRNYTGGGSYGSSRRFDVARDGRFLMVKVGARDAAASPSLVLVQNWFEELRRLAPAR